MSEMLGRLFGALSTPGPSVGVEIAADCVTGVALTWVKSTPKVIGHARVRLPAGVLVPSAAATNVIDRDVVVEAVRQVLKQLPRRVTRIGLVVPDSVGKVSFVKFDQIPGKPADLARLVAWQVRKAVPFRVEDAQLASTPGARLPGGGQEFVVTLIRRDIVEEYEGVCSSAGAHAGLVDLATFNLVNAATAMSPPSHADWLLLHVGYDTSTLAIVRGQDLIFFRHRPTSTEGDLADLVHQSAMYYEDRLEGRGMARTVLVRSAETSVTSDTARRTLEERLGTEVEGLASVRVTSALGVDPVTLDPLAAPIGLVVREQMSAG